MKNKLVYLLLLINRSSDVSSNTEVQGSGASLSVSILNQFALIVRLVELSIIMTRFEY